MSPTDLEPAGTVIRAKICDDGGRLPDLGPRGERRDTRAQTLGLRFAMRAKVANHGLVLVWN
jgi:hypothetical protein